MVVTTDAFVLKSLKYRDTSRIVTLYTREFGLLQGIAKGIRTLKNNFGGALEPLTISQVVLYKKENRDLHLITNGSVLFHLKNIHSSLSHLSIGFAISEILYRCTNHEEKNEQLFQLIVDTATELNTSPSPLKYLYAFQLKYAQYMGYAPSFDRCSACEKDIGEEHRVEFQVLNGTVLCWHCAHVNGTRSTDQTSYTMNLLLSREACLVLRTLSSVDVRVLREVTIDPGLGNEIEYLLRRYFQYHFGELRYLKSLVLLQ
ncbi:MAG: DNA repair protein RecO [Bacteroidetes bacterium]|nr:DNA repair protein RecO [Bacteroidota bacterium]